LHLVMLCLPHIVKSCSICVLILWTTMFWFKDSLELVFLDLK
jgi:hypothetical protein